MDVHLRRTLLHAVALLLSLSQLALAAEFFVATGGDNSAAGTAGAPWRTLQHAANQVGHGDRVVVRPGSYAGFHLTSSGTEVAPIEFFAEPGVLVNQPNPIRTDHGINLENASHIIVDGFSVTGMKRAGVRSVGVNGNVFASNVTIRNVRSYDNGYWGILTGFVNDLTIENNETSGSVVEHGIYVSNSGDRPIIRNNYTWGNNRNGIHINGDADLGGDGIISDALIAGNIIHGNGVEGGSGINMDGVQDSRIENNLIYDNHASGISLYRINGGGGSTGNFVVNNTIHVAADGRWALNIQNGSTNNTVHNNILITEHATRGAIDISANSLAGFTSDNNIVNPPFNAGGSFLSLANWQSQTGQDLHSLIAEPSELFVDWQNGNYELLATAAARNAGTAQFAPAFDLTGKPRPIDGSFDIGAYEFGLAPLPGDYNGDWYVDAADYTMWRNTLGTEGENLPADGDNSGQVDQGDYAVWKINYGNSSASASSFLIVPEPMALSLSIGVVVLVAMARIPQRRFEWGTTGDGSDCQRSVATHHCR